MNIKKMVSKEYLKSGLSLNTHVGCPLGCRYCVLTTSIDDFFGKPTPIKNARDILNELFRPGSIFINGLTPIYINNRTDPFLPEVIESTYELLKQCIVNNIKSPIIVITKLAPDASFRAYCEKLNILFFYTYSNLKGIDYNSDDGINIGNVSKILFNVPYENRYHYYRPIIPGYNDSLLKFEEAIKTVGIYCKATVIGGFRVNQANSEEFHVSLFDKNHKLLDDSFMTIVYEMVKKYHICIVRHTSCAIALHMKKANKLQYFHKEGHCLEEKCINYNVCDKGENFLDQKTVSNIINELTDSRYIWESNGRIVFQNEVSQEVVAFLKSTLGLSVIASKVILSPSEARITF